MSVDEKRTTLDPEVEKALPAPLADAIRSGSVPENILKHSHDADEAMKAFESHRGEVIEIDAATNKRLLRRIDFNLIPVSMQSPSRREASRLTLMLRSCVSCTVSTIWTRLRSPTPASWASRKTSGLWITTTNG